MRFAAFSLAAAAALTVAVATPAFAQKAANAGAVSGNAAADAAANAPLPTKIVINPGDRGEQSRFAVYTAWKQAIEQALRKEKAGNSSASLSTDATADLGLTRSKVPDIFIAPAHVIGSAVRYGYVPVLGLDKPVQAVLVVPKDSAINNFEQARGKQLGLPTQDSVVTYLVRGETNAANTTIKRHFGSVYETRYQDALLPCLQLKRCDVVAVERAVYERWAAAGEPVRVVMESRPAPAMGVAIKDGTKPGAAALRSAMLKATQNGLGPAGDDAKLAALDASSFDYVATLGYFTPRALQGVAVVDAKAVADLMAKGARYVDTRTEVEFKAGHAAGAILVPYHEKSAKDADFDHKLDQFDLAAAVPDRSTELIFACNGPECWKSFKASQAALKAGYTKVHWFRGGFPEWRGAGMKIDAGS